MNSYIILFIIIITHNQDKHKNSSVPIQDQKYAESVAVGCGTGILCGCCRKVHLSALFPPSRPLSRSVLGQFHQFMVSVYFRENNTYPLSPEIMEF